MNTFGKNITFTIFGESHGPAIGGVLGGLPAGFSPDFSHIDGYLKRRNHRAVYATPRAESDAYEILSGLFEGKTNGAPLAFLIRNNDTKSAHYDDLKRCMRPGHADYPAYVKYGGNADYRGGGHFSGRLTAPLVFAGALALQLLQARGVRVCSHILSIGDVTGESLLGTPLDGALFDTLRKSEFPVLDNALKTRMLDVIKAAAADKNSVGGVVELIIDGVGAGIGDPFFGSVESRLSAMLFSVPAVKGVEFGAGFGIAKMTGFDANDAYYMDGGTVKTRTNNNGGILGGITNGMPVVCRVAIKPTPSIFQTQDTVDVLSKKDTQLTLKGRHDCCIVPRAAAALEAAAGLAVLDMLGGN